MKKKILYSYLLLFFAGSVYAQIVDIPDVNFKNALLANESVNTNGDDEIQIAEAEVVTSLYVHESGIASLEGINAFTSLEHLICSSNELTSIDVSELTELKTLSASNNSISSFSYAPTNMLESLGVANNGISDLSLLQLEELTALKTLLLGGNPIGPSLFIEHETLEDLGVSTCGLEEIDISAIPNLISLSAQDNPLVLSAPLINESLKILVVIDSNLEGLDLSGLPNLQGLIAYNNNISFLNIDENINLAHLEISNNELVALDVSGLPTLSFIGVSNNNLTELIIKNGAISENFELLSFDENPDLSFICADEGELDVVFQQLEAYGYTDVTVTTECALGVSDIDSIGIWSMYPNPSRGNLTIESSGEQIEQIQVYDVHGRVVKQFKIMAQFVELQLQELPASMYIIEVRTATGFSTKRLVKL